MNRAIKNKVRGKQRANVPPLPAPSHPFVLARYNGRANYGAGNYEVEAIKPLQPDGIIVNWLGNTPPNR